MTLFSFNLVIGVKLKMFFNGGFPSPNIHMYKYKITTKQHPTFIAAAPRLRNQCRSTRLHHQIFWFVYLALLSLLLSDLERLNTVMWRRSVVVCRPTASGLEPTSSHIIVLIALITKLHSFVPLIDKLRSCSSVPLC